VSLQDGCGTRIKVEAFIASLVWDTCELVMLSHGGHIWFLQKLMCSQYSFFSLGGGVAKVFLFCGSLGVTGLYISPNLYTQDAVTGYFTPSHVKHQRLLLQFLSAPEDGRKWRPKHAEYYCS
jgi:hypothetical protein